MTENQAKTAMTENQAKTAMTENQAKTAMTENQAKTAMTENQAKTAMTENRVRTVGAPLLEDRVVTVQTSTFEGRDMTRSSKLKGLALVGRSLEVEDLGLTVLKVTPKDRLRIDKKFSHVTESDDPFLYAMVQELKDGAAYPYFESIVDLMEITINLHPDLRGFYNESFIHCKERFTSFSDIMYDGYEYSDSENSFKKCAYEFGLTYDPQ